MDPNRGETVYETKPVGGIPNAYDSVLKLDNVRTEHYETRFRYSTNQGVQTKRGIHMYAIMYINISLIFIIIFKQWMRYDIYIRNMFPT